MLSLRCPIERLGRQTTALPVQVVVSRSAADLQQYGGQGVPASLPSSFARARYATFPMGFLLRILIARFRVAD